MQWYFSITYDRQPIRLKAERIHAGDLSEQYRITARNRPFVLQNNLPLLQSKKLKHWRPKWIIVEGQLQSTGLLELICKKLESHLL